jgi:hypothetical protein
VWAFRLCDPHNLHVCVASEFSFLFVPWTDLVCALRLCDPHNLHVCVASEFSLILCSVDLSCVGVQVVFRITYMCVLLCFFAFIFCRGMLYAWMCGCVELNHAGFETACFFFFFFF